MDITELEKKLEEVNKQMLFSKLVIEPADNYIYIVCSDWTYDCTWVKRRDFDIKKVEDIMEWRYEVI
jgi:hypothetical protein